MNRGLDYFNLNQITPNLLLFFQKIVTSELAYITLVPVDLHGVSDLRWFLHVGVVGAAFLGLVLLLVGNL